MASSTISRGIVQFQPAWSRAATHRSRFAGGLAIGLFVMTAVGLTASMVFGQAEGSPRPNHAMTPVIHYEVPQVAAQEPIGPPPAGDAANEVIPAPPSEADILGAPITTVTADIRVKKDPRVHNDVPPSAVPASLKYRGEMSYVMHRPGSAAICYVWDAPATCNNPLYFEDANLERHGYSPRYLRAFQPVLSGAEFFATIPTLPYQMTATPPCECVYTLGEYRSGNCVPYQINYPPCSAAGGLAEAGTAVGLVFLIP